MKKQVNIYLTKEGKQMIKNGITPPNVVVKNVAHATPRQRV